jgi:hypothetical protein
MKRFGLARPVLDHVNWVEQDWRIVLVFNESKLCLYKSGGRVMVSDLVSDMRKVLGEGE